MPRVARSGLPAAQGRPGRWLPVPAGPPHPHHTHLCPKQLICIWKPLIRLHVWLRHRPRSLPAALPEGAATVLGMEQSRPRDLLSELQTTPFPHCLALPPRSRCSTQHGEKVRSSAPHKLQPPRDGLGSRRGDRVVASAPCLSHPPVPVLQGSSQPSPAQGPSPGAFSCCKSGRGTCQLCCQQEHSQHQPLRSAQRPINPISQGPGPLAKLREQGRFQQGCSRVCGCREIRNHLSAGARDGTLRS